MQRFLELLEFDPKWQIKRGELMRQMGRFDEAVEALNAVQLDGYSGAKAAKIESLARG